MKKTGLRTLSDRLLYALEFSGVKKADLARAIHVQPQTIQHLCHGDVQSSRFTFELATVLGLNTKWLALGEGEPFSLSDSEDRPSKIPLLTNDQLILLAKGSDSREFEIIKWEILNTLESGIFCASVSDSSMLPLLPLNAKVFFKKIIFSSRKKIARGSIVMAYLPFFNSILIREIHYKNNNIYLSPLNTNLFKEIPLTDDIVIFAEAIECHFSLNKKSS